MYCPECGSSNSDKSKFCFNCGNMLHMSNNNLSNHKIQQENIKQSYKLEINWSKQFFLNNPVITISTNNIESILVKNGGNFCKDIIEGCYQITFTCAIRKTVVNLDIHSDTLLEIKLNKITGKIDIENKSDNDFSIILSK